MSCFICTCTCLCVFGSWMAPFLFSNACMHACTCNCVIEFQRGGVVLFPLTSVCGIRSLTNKWNESYQYIMYTPGMSCLVPSSNVHLCSLCSDVWKCISVWWILLALLGFNFDYFFFSLTHTELSALVMVNPEIKEAVKSLSSLPVLRQMFINLSATREGEREREGGE